MSKLILWKNQELNKLRRDIDRLFNRCRSDFGVSLFLDDVSEVPTIDLTETEDTLIVRAALHGVNPENLDISVTHDTLTISGKKRGETVEDSGYYHRVTRRLSSFKRVVRLPCRVKTEEIKATYKKGMLRIVMPKWGPEKARFIKVEVKTS